MIYLLTPDQILYECLQIAKHHMAEVLHTSPDLIDVEITRDDDGRVLPKFGVDPEAVKGLAEDDIREVMRHVYADVREDLQARIKDARHTRREVLERLRGKQEDIHA